MRIHSLLLVLVMAAVTALIRFLPFLLFPEDREPPAFLSELSGLLPAAVIGMLVVYCLRNVSLFERPHGLPELFACAAVVLLHARKRNTLLSILGGTLVYMALLRIL